VATVGGEFDIEREMGCTREEFLGWLPGAAAGAPIEVLGDLIRIHSGGGEVRIQIRQAPARRLGLLSLPVLRVSMRFQGLQADARGEFLRRFDLFTRRGGG